MVHLEGNVDDLNPDSYCGLYCGACSVAMYGTTGRADPFVVCLGRVPREHIACGGCKSDSVYGGCNMCEIRRCARAKGVAHCTDCTDYPCRTYGRWQSLARMLPHAREAQPSLDRIRLEGVDSWLAVQKQRWSCPDCGAPFSWYATACHGCGHPLMSEAHTLSGWRRALCRVILPVAYRKGQSLRQRQAPPCGSE